MKKLKKYALLLVALALGFASCKTDVDTKYVTVEKEVEKTVTKEVPTDMTSHEAVAVYHQKQSTSGIDYNLVNYEENEDGTLKKDESGNYVKIETAQTVAAGTKLADLAKTFYGCKAKGLVESLQADGTYVVNIFYDRNSVTITADADGKTYTASGLFGQNTALEEEIQKELTSGKFIASTTIPTLYPAENASYTVTIETANAAESDGFIKVPAGSFKRSTATSSAGANESNTYTITLSKDLYVCDHEVTQGEWEKYMIYYGEVYPDDKNSLRPAESYGKGENYPVYYVNWYEAVIYCNLLSMAKGLTPAYYITDSSGTKTDPDDWINISGSNIKKTDDGKFYYDGLLANSKLDYKGEGDTDGGIQLDTTANGYRLPTEAEWEYAALGSYKNNENWNGYGDSSKTSEYVFAGYDGTKANIIRKYVCYLYTSGRNTQEVKGKLPNSYGLYDMNGNVGESCYDWSGSYSSSDENDPAGSASGSFRVVRGGSCYSSSTKYCDVSWRDGWSPNCRFYYLGFRLVRNAN